MGVGREFDNPKGEEALKAYEKRHCDRFEKIPKDGRGLIMVVRLRWIAKQYGIERLVLKNGNMSAYLVSNEKSPFYNAPEFGMLLRYLTEHPRTTRISENKGRRAITFTGVASVDAAYEIFKQLHE